MTPDVLDSQTTTVLEQLPQHWYDFLKEQTIIVTLLRIGVTVITAYVMYMLVRHILIRVALRIMSRTHSRDHMHESSRQRTVVRLVEYTTTAVIWVLAGLMVLGTMGLDVRPLLAGAGVAGLAIGFGAQYLVKDLISGFFIILENQYRVGDVACVGDVCGVVEDVTLRKTVLRDMDGTVHHVPNGEIRKTSNLTRDFSKININFRLPLDVNLADAYGVVDAIGVQLQSEDEWKERVRTAPHVLRVEDITESAVIVKIVGETAPGSQWDVAGEMRRRLLSALHKKGVGPAYPRRVVYQEGIEKKAPPKKKKN